MGKRGSQDRRKRKSSGFPLRDERGNIVRRERRMQADRRLGQIEAEWREIMHESGHATTSW